MLYSEIIAVCSEIHTKHINTLCGQNVELLNVKLAVLDYKGLRHITQCIVTSHHAMHCYPCYRYVFATI